MKSLCDRAVLAPRCRPGSSADRLVASERASTRPNRSSPCAIRLTVLADRAGKQRASARRTGACWCRRGTRPRSALGRQRAALIGAQRLALPFRRLARRRVSRARGTSSLTGPKVPGSERARLPWRWPATPAHPPASAFDLARSASVPARRRASCGTALGGNRERVRDPARSDRTSCRKDALPPQHGLHGTQVRSMAVMARSPPALERRMIEVDRWRLRRLIPTNVAARAFARV